MSDKQMNEKREHFEDRLIDQALQERVGGQQPPDLSDRCPCRTSRLSRSPAARLGGESRTPPLYLGRGVPRWSP